MAFEAVWMFPPQLPRPEDIAGGTQMLNFLRIHRGRHFPLELFVLDGEHVPLDPHAQPVAQQLWVVRPSCFL